MLRVVASGRAKRSLASIYRAALASEGGGGQARAAAAATAAATEGGVGGIGGDEASSSACARPRLPLLPLPLLSPHHHQLLFLSPTTSAAATWGRQQQQQQQQQQWRSPRNDDGGEQEQRGWWQQRPHGGRRRGYASSSSSPLPPKGDRLEAFAAHPDRVLEPSPDVASAKASISNSSSSGTPKPPPPPPPLSSGEATAAAAAAAADKRAERAAVVAAHRLRLQQQQQQQLDADLAAARLQQQQRQQLLRNASAAAAEEGEDAAAAPAAAASQQQQPRPAQQLCRIVQYVRSGVEVALRVTTTPGAAPYAGVDASAPGAAATSVRSAAAAAAAAARLQQQQQQQQQQPQSPNDYVLEWSRRSIPSADALGKSLLQQQEQERLEREQERRREGGGGAAAGTPPPPPGGALARLRERGAQAALRTKKMLQLTFLPAGYPSSVGAGYVEFAAWQAVTNLATTANGVLASTFLLYSVGLGAGAIPTAGALNWVLKDGLGQVGTLLFGKAVAHNFDIHSKTWYFLSLVLLAGATGLEIATFVAPGAFLALGSAANAIKGLSWMAGGSTRSVFNLSFARDNNIADITAKGTSQYIFASLFGTTAGVSIAAYVGQSPAAAAAAFGALSALSLYGGFRTVKSIPLPTLNSTRLQLLAARYLKCIREGGDTMRSVAAAEAAIAGGAVAAAGVGVGVGGVGGGLAFLRGARGGGGAAGGRSKPRFSDFHDEDDVRPSGGGLSGSRGRHSTAGGGGGAPRAAAFSASGDADPSSSGKGGGGRSSDGGDDEDDEDDGGACGLGPAPIEMSASAMRSRRAALVAAVQRRRAAVLNSSSSGNGPRQSPLPPTPPPFPGAADDADFLASSSSSSPSPPPYSSYSSDGQQRGDDYQREYRLPDEDDDSCELGLPSPQELAAVDPPLPWLMGDQRILNPAIRVGTALDALVGGSPALLLVLMSTFRYEKALVVPGNAAAVANAAAAAAGGGAGGGGAARPAGGGGGGGGGSGWTSSAAAAPGDVHVVLHADAQGPDIVQAYLQACILRRRLRGGATVAPGDLAALRLVLHDTLLASKRLAPSFMRALERQGWMTDKIVVEAHRRRARW